jgi:hypothetical protein
VTSDDVQAVLAASGLPAENERLRGELAERDRGAARLISENASLSARNADLEQALRDLVAAFVNPGDGGEFEAGEVPVLDKARALIAGTEAQ